MDKQKEAEIWLRVVEASLHAGRGDYLDRGKEAVQVADHVVCEYKRRYVK